LSLGEAAFLAGLPKAPNRYSPVRSPASAKARRDWVLDRMVEDGRTTAEEAAQAQAQPLEIRHRQETEQVQAPYFAEEVRRELLARYGDKGLYEAGLSVRTSLDPRLQVAADKVLRTGLIAYERSHGGWRGAVARIDPKGDWPAHLVRVPVPGSPSKWGGASLW
jgi:penicillin-binding protein 1A